MNFINLSAHKLMFVIFFCTSLLTGDRGHGREDKGQRLANGIIDRIIHLYYSKCD